MMLYEHMCILADIIYHYVASDVPEIDLALTLAQREEMIEAWEVLEYPMQTHDAATHAYVCRTLYGYCGPQVIAGVLADHQRWMADPQEDTEQHIQDELAAIAVWQELAGVAAERHSN